MERIYIGMGSNLAEPTEQLRSAIQALAQLPDTQLVGVSAFYQSDSLLPGQPRYTNAVAALDSRLAPLDLLDALQAIETGQGRERLERWGPRTLDLDILLFGDRLIDEPRLKVPHYHMQARAFVLYPLAELAPADLRLADGRLLRDLLAACPFAGLERLAPN
ncbi:MULTISPECIES: 2-amino-4-hydroxy-6-hydroxymethyldihydropteridine diphosphokinase [Pseudomonas]|jgi:2-amino-4-hydroxy-6-hydroxymethyldihydropteridine diphosphokinase|uniref:2-amino-4-hydroxy-6-hydroxymethyldihydropteridine pyrophosphokinase n=1 Tax=Pseudomonas frederiksbergensis TaxID=104087 RepID=A0A0B1YU91_9PSED|nr:MULTISPECIES: 2-amino-4-hydroxy-6-hydroxymethyldihydropteridine diphosphokinase [Pseudomonas]KHK62040.1 2-amino-4-hydroxy-6-hydroxymethyldihydropteridine pyrophosphokinase [Pseudomonas frederiksbergensis]KJH83191.1 2-amino-4-hydroxy-6-hydroxymethyldihydropteridine pyrophosphokinase [Pseudomonas fluorescens]MBI6619776.1 2-amino-4-hydroxy-6-hydroxymethyldihydropteridine diphosphokinase [Pseudomonas corrugata]MBI6694165.1 2-amino-4-hydroxy-6-hydroxymethyldihydropteridine diphosphokinase [Pseudo